MNQDIRNTCDMLTGNINRMMVTDDQNELFQMYAHACRNLSRILEARSEAIREAHKEEFLKAKEAMNAALKGGTTL